MHLIVESKFIQLEIHELFLTLAVLFLNLYKGNKDNCHYSFVTSD
jgi:hypothetical protein